MAISMRERPILKGDDAAKFLAEEKRIDDERAKAIKNGKLNAKRKDLPLCLTEK